MSDQRTARKKQFWMMSLINAMMGRADKEYLEDCKRLVPILERLLGHSVSLIEAYAFWQWRSNDWDAGWLILPKNDNELADVVKEYVDRLMEDDDE